MNETFPKPDGIIEIDRSRCLRMRFNKNSCNTCVKSCRLHAITIDNKVDIHRNICSECMMCVSVCPTGSFGIRTMNFYSLLARLRKIQAPVLGCHVKPGLVAHEKTACLGFLSEEHLIALLFFVQKPFQINLAECKNCRNHFIVDVLRERLKCVAKKTSMDAFQIIQIVENKADLDYEDISYDRRGFFRALKDLTVEEARGIFNNTEREENALSYSDKVMPFRRALLNSSFSVLPEDTRKRVLRKYYYDVKVDQTCNNCFSCVGMCSTGALKSTEEESDRTLFFNSSLCSGCGLCESFCRSNSIRLIRGFSGLLPFQFSTAEEVFSVKERTRRTKDFPLEEEQLSNDVSV